MVGQVNLALYRRALSRCGFNLFVSKQRAQCILGPCVTWHLAFASDRIRDKSSPQSLDSCQENHNQQYSPKDFQLPVVVLIAHFVDERRIRGMKGSRMPISERCTTEPSDNKCQWTYIVTQKVGAKRTIPTPQRSSLVGEWSRATRTHFTLLP
jgi:hypothetical protein